MKKARHRRARTLRFPLSSAQSQAKDIYAARSQDNALRMRGGKGSGRQKILFLELGGGATGGLRL